jgi:uncharacterized protein
MSMVPSEQQRDAPQSAAILSPHDALLNLDLEQKLPFTINRLRGASVTILGRKGTGKSTTLRVLIEELLGKGRACAIVDPQNEYFTLGERYDVIVAGRTKNARVPLDPAKAGALAEFSLTHNVPVVLSLAKYADEERFALLKNFFTRLWGLEEDAKKPYFVLLEEAHKYLPQVGTTPVFGILSDIFLLGRKNGLATFLATQRSQKMHKDTISQSEVYFLHRVSHPKDVEVYEDLLPRPAKEVRDLNSRLRKGSAIVMYEEDLPADADEEIPMEMVTRVQIRRSHTFHAGATPTFEGSGPVVLRPLDTGLLQELQNLLAEAEPGDSPREREALRRIRELEEESALKTAHLEQVQASLHEQTQRVGILEEQIRLLGQIKVSFDGQTIPVLDVPKMLNMSVEQATIHTLALTRTDGTGTRDDPAAEELKATRRLLYQRNEEFNKIKGELRLAQEELRNQSTRAAHEPVNPAGQVSAPVPLEKVLTLDERVRWEQIQQHFLIADPIERSIALTVLAYERQQDLTIAHLTLLLKKEIPRNTSQKIREHLPHVLIGLKIITETSPGSNHAKHYKGQLRTYLSQYFAPQHVERMYTEALLLVQGIKR